MKPPYISHKGKAEPSYSPLIPLILLLNDVYPFHCLSDSEKCFFGLVAPNNENKSSEERWKCVSGGLKRRGEWTKPILFKCLRILWEKHSSKYVCPCQVYFSKTQSRKKTSWLFLSLVAQSGLRIPWDLEVETQEGMVGEGERTSAGINATESTLWIFPFPPRNGTLQSREPL